MMNELWDKVLVNIEHNINKQSFDFWLKNTEQVSITDNTVTIRVPDEVARKHLSENYLPMITETARSVTGQEFFFEFITKNGSSEYTIASSLSQNPGTRPVHLENTVSILNPNYTFENFVVGPNNQLSHAAAISVSRTPGTQYNPLFIYGGTGLGKTHLMQAIGHHIIKEKPFLKVLYVTSENFVNEFIHAIKTGTVSSFKIKYRNVDILLIDDIHFIEKKEMTQEEFFHTFNDLHQNKKQIVISSDRPPKDLSNLEDRLITRFEWGLITDIQIPDLETREAILRDKAEKLDLHLSDDLLNYIARRIKSSIRKLESALSQLKHVSSIHNDELTIQHAKTHLKDLFDDDPNKKITIPDIMTKVCEKFNVTVDDLVSKSRQSRVTYPRFIAMYLSRRLTDYVTKDIGREFGDRDHSTVLHAMDKVEKIMSEDEEFKEQIEDIISELKS